LTELKRPTGAQGTISLPTETFEQPWTTLSSPSENSVRSVAAKRSPPFDRDRL